ncbi:hypothetical protein TetV_339 [Tetraselmis virus 1]|uniref:Uncharacterized protein n=1 Tax=Tetraselmis virus 1 TaxID=2060617 RepID=A0A2P0VNF0_9VIRU|nr:hypothetical protein QJ968_gp339 [Tetraselmis virus 1]AUF82431.1 hypothetical protein TetV_339 [Tetraselmis virus 1]
MSYEQDNSKIVIVAQLQDSEWITEEKIDVRLLECAKSFVWFAYICNTFESKEEKKMILSNILSNITLLFKKYITIKKITGYILSDHRPTINIINAYTKTLVRQS